MLKRKFSSKPDYKLTTKFKAKTEYINNEDFKGYMTIFIFEALEKPLITTYNNEEYCIANENYIWLQALPSNEHYCMTTLLNEKQEIIEWYFDIIKEQGIIDDIPYFDDLYLDVIVSPKVNAYLIDEDELQEALEKKFITLDEFKKAYDVANHILKEKSKIDELTTISYKYLNYMLERLE